MKLSAIADDVNRTLNFGERRGAVCLFLTVISRRSFPTAIRNFVGQIRIQLDALCSRPRIPNGWFAATQPDSVVRCRVGDICRHAVTIIFVELGVTLRVHSFDVLRALHEDCRHFLGG